MAHPLSVRENILLYRQQGHSMTEIHETLGVSYGSVRSLCARFSQSDQSSAGHHAALVPRYERCGPQEKRWSNEVYQEALSIKRLHPRWGAPRLMIDLQAQLGTDKLPTIRTLERWFRQAGLGKPPRVTGEPTIGRARGVHNIWELDAKENLVLLDGQEACYLTTVDEKSGAWLASPVFPL